MLAPPVMLGGPVDRKSLSPPLLTPPPPSLWPLYSDEAACRRMRLAPPGGSVGGVEGRRCQMGGPIQKHL